MTQEKEFRPDSLVEAFTNTYPTLPEEHILIHAGKLWEAQHQGLNVAADASIELFILPSRTRQILHMLFTFISSLKGTFFIYENTSKTYVGGNAITSYNRNRYEEEPLNAAPQICHTPAGSGDGTLLFKGLLGGGRANGVFGAVGRDANEILLDPGIPYLIRVTSGANANDLQINAEYYERFHSDAPTTTTTSTTTTTV